ncbi:hypothetical protein [Thermosipho africanus]|uniref:hypothetical protein n=1 Tax=Thermosipho africanus TaxID=2421 RepID=UPI00030FDD47|nr:hypothetical protein [Thermosipho africanus]
MKVYGRNILKEILETNTKVRMIYFSDTNSAELTELIEEVKKEDCLLQLQIRKFCKG